MGEAGTPINMDLYDRRGQTITDWRSWTRPKERAQWRATRSAMELARAWFTAPAPTVPAEISNLFASHPRTVGALLKEGWPELKTSLPYPGEGRNHDLVLVGQVGEQAILVSVEAKVDETMGPPVGVYWRKSKRSPGSRAWRRIDALLAAAFGAEAVAVEEPWSGLPYQMLTALVATSIEAAYRSCSLAVFCLHEFVTESAKPAFLRRNDSEFRAFLGALGVTKPATSHLHGPFNVATPGTSSTIPVLVGKAQFRWGSRD